MATRSWLWLTLATAHLYSAATITPPEDCFPIADVVFLIDGSDSISDEEFHNQKTFIHRFVETTDIGKDKIRIGYTVVSSTIGDTLNLSGGPKADILAELDNITQPQEGTRTDMGIVYIDNMFFTLGRVGTMYIGVILTDGRAKYQRATQAEATVAKQSGVFLIAIGVGRLIQDELLSKIASTPSNSYHLKPMNYSLTLLKETVKYLGKEWCSDIVTGLVPGEVTMSHKASPQKSIYIGTDPGFNGKNASTVISLLSNKNNINGNISDIKLNFTSTPLNSLYLKQIQDSTAHKSLHASDPLPQTTVFPVTKSNIGQILKTLMTSKKAKAQGLAFVKSRQDLRDALKILLASRAMSTRRMIPGANNLTSIKQNTTDSAWSFPVLQVVTTNTPDTSIVSNNFRKTAATNKDIKLDNKEFVSSKVRSQNNKFILENTKAEGQLDFKRKQSEQSANSRQPQFVTSRKGGQYSQDSKFQFNDKNQKSATDTAHIYNPENTKSRRKTAKHNTFTQNFTTGVVNFEEEMLLEVGNNITVADQSALQSSYGTSIGLLSKQEGKYSTLTDIKIKTAADRGKEIKSMLSKAKNAKPKTQLALDAPLSSLNNEFQPNSGDLSIPKQTQTIFKKLGRIKSYAADDTFGKPTTKYALRPQLSQTQVLVSKQPVGSIQTLDTSAINLKPHKLVDFHPKIAFVQGISGVKQLDMTHMHVLKDSPKVANTTDAKIYSQPQQKDKRPKKVFEYARTKTELAAADINRYSEKYKPSKSPVGLQEPVDLFKQTPLSQMSMFKGSGRMSFGVSKNLHLTEGRFPIKKTKISDIKGQVTISSEALQDTTTQNSTPENAYSKKVISKIKSKTKLPRLYSSGPDKGGFLKDFNANIGSVSSQSKKGPFRKLRPIKPKTKDDTVEPVATILISKTQDSPRTQPQNQVTDKKFSHSYSSPVNLMTEADIVKPLKALSVSKTRLPSRTLPKKQITEKMYSSSKYRPASPVKHVPGVHTFKLKKDLSKSKRRLPSKTRPQNQIANEMVPNSKFSQVKHVHAVETFKTKEAPLVSKLGLPPRTRPQNQMASEMVFNSESSAYSRSSSSPSSNGPSSDSGYQETPQYEAQTMFSSSVPTEGQSYKAHVHPHGSNTEQLITQQKERNHTLDKSIALRLCAKSRFVDGIGYASKPDSCTDFIQCFHVHGLIKVEVGHCPIGSFFDERFTICRPYDRRVCQTDPCYGRKADTYGHPSDCRGYWRCENGRSIPGCCPTGFAYGSDGTCVMNPNCTSPCLEQISNCRLRAFKTNDRFYFEMFSGFGWMIRTCPSGTRFRSDRCKCELWVESETTECSPQVSLDFEDRQLDSTKSVYNRNVKVEAGAGKFEGQSMITLWRFTGISFGKSVLITMRFKVPEPEKHNDKLMHLLSNCCIGCPGRPGPTIDIALLTDSTGGIIVLSTYSSASGEKFIFIPYFNTKSGWNSLTYSYDGEWLVGSVNNVTARQQMKGTIESRPYPLLLGSCGTVPSFQGYIDDFKIYLCKSKP